MMMMIRSSITFCLPLIWILFVHTEEEATTKIIKRDSRSSSSTRKGKKAEPLLLQSFNRSSKTLLYTNQQREWIQPNSNNCLYFVSSLEAGGSNKHGRSILMEMGVYGMGD
jgi:hypothetical protein